MVYVYPLSLVFSVCVCMSLVDGDSTHNNQRCAKERDELHLDDDPKDQENFFSRSNLNETSFAYA